MIVDEIESVETASPNIYVEQTEQLKRIFRHVFSEGRLIRLIPNSIYLLGK
jgi:hypothetical protein